jgi:hypothetical protein
MFKNINICATSLSVIIKTLHKTIKVYLTTDEQLDSLKNNYKFALKSTLTLILLTWRK